MANVRSGRTIAERLAFYSHDDPTTGCRVWHGVRGGPGIYKGGGYGQLGVVVVRGKKARMKIASRLAWECAHGPIPKGLQVLHNCPSGDNSLCINVEHLWLGTPADNVADMIAKGRAVYRRGEAAPSARLSAEQVRAIRADSRRSCDIASFYGVSATHIGHIRTGRKWAHVQ